MSILKLEKFHTSTIRDWCPKLKIVFRSKDTTMVLGRVPSHAVPVKCKWGWRLGFKLGVTNPTVTHSLRQALHNQYGGGFVETPTFCIETSRIPQHCTIVLNQEKMMLGMMKCIRIV